MAFLNSMSVVGSGLTAQQQRIDVIAENMTNINTTRTEDGGGTYRRKLVVLEAQDNTFGGAMERANQRKNEEQMDGGVKVAQIIEDESDFKISFDPTHPDADENGYVQLPNVDLIKETADAMAASQAYNAAVTAFNVLKEVTASGLQIGK